jgi:hypothetical protein
VEILKGGLVFKKMEANERIYSGLIKSLLPEIIAGNFK